MESNGRDDSSKFMIPSDPWLFLLGTALACGNKNGSPASSKDEFTHTLPYHECEHFEERQKFLDWIEFLLQKKLRIECKEERDKQECVKDKEYNERDREREKEREMLHKYIWVVCV